MLACAAGARAASLELTDLAPEPLPVPGLGTAELSGITWAGGSRFYAVDDGRSRLFPLEISFDEARGTLTKLEAGEFVVLKGSHDSEGIAWREATKTVFVTDEVAHEIREYDPASGALLRSLPAPPRFRGRLRKNRGFEGIALSPGGEHVYLANEAPLQLDGDDAGALSGAWVRIQRLDASFAPAGQWAYRTESGLGFVGVVDLMVAPGGELLVLERAFTGGGFSARVFEIDFSKATDVSGIEKLRNRDDFWPLRKEKIWERRGGFQNFEGIALGPELSGGGRLVLLVSDGGGQRHPTVLPLRLSVAKAR